MKYVTITLCCCFVAMCIGVIVMSSLDIVNKDDTNVVDYSQLTYIALGDSITYGADGSLKDHRQAQYPYPVLVQHKLHLRDSVNYGISGSTVASGANSFCPMSERYVNMADGDIISVLGGVNDFGHNIPLGTIADSDTTTFYGALNILAKGLKTKYPNAFIFFMTPYKRAGTMVNINGNTLEQFANAVKEVCVANGLPFLDLYNYGNFESEMNSSQSDGLHPSQSFYKNYTAKQIAEFICLYYNK